MTWLPFERHGLPEFVDVFPFERELGQDTTDDTVLFVDIGSAFGSQSLLIRKRFPNLRGRVVIEDQQHVIDAWSTKPHPSIEALVYDFFTPQPVKGKS